MSLFCPNCQSQCIKRNGHIHNRKQNHRCLICSRQFVAEPTNKVIPEGMKANIRQALLERVSLEGICRIFEVSMSWLLQYISQIIEELPDHLHATAIAKAEELDVAVLELDEQYSYVGNKANQQWLWLVFHSVTRQVLAMHVGKRTRQSAEALLAKLPEELKKKPSFTQISLQCTSKSFLGSSIEPLERNREKPVILRDLTALSGKE